MKDSIERRREEVELRVDLHESTKEEEVQNWNGGDHSCSSIDSKTLMRGEEVPV